MKNKRIVSILMVLMLIFNLSSFAATEVNEQETVDNDAAYEEAIKQENETQTDGAEESEPAPEVKALQVNEKSAQEAYDILAGTKILSNTPAINAETVSRGDFAAMVTALSGVKEVIGADTGYRDATSSNSNFAAISYVVSNGWMKGNKGLFKPDDPIILSDALKALIGMLTHNAAMKETQYLSRARSLGLLSGIKAGLETPLSGGAVCKLLQNALEADYMEEYGVEGGNAVYKNAGPLITAVHNIRVVTGIVTATKRTGLYNAQDVDGIKIGENFYFSENDYSSFLGMNVDCYVDNSPSKDNEAVLVMEAKPNEIVNLVAEDINTLVNKETLYYYPEKGSNRKNEMKMSSVTPVIYNGIYSGTVSNFTTLKLTLRDIADRPECATLRLVDNNSDGRADAVIVWYYETYVISYADGDNMYYRDTYAKKSFSLMDYAEDKDTQICVTTNGKAGKIGDIRENSVVSVAISANDKVVDIYVNSNIIYDGIVAAVDDNAYEISGQWYEKSVYYEENYAVAPGERETKNTIKPGKVGTVYLDFLNRIVMGNFENKLNYAYLTAAGKNGTMGDKYEVKLFVFDTNTKESEFKIYPLKEKFKLDGSGVRRKNVETTALYDGNGNVAPQLIKYKVNTDGEIDEIQTAYSAYKELPRVKDDEGNDKYTDNNENGVFDEGIDEYVYSLNFSVNDHWYSDGNFELNYKGKATFCTNPDLLGNKFFISDSSNILIIPDDVTNEDNFNVATTVGQVFSDKNESDVEIYDVQESSFANLVICRMNTAASASFSNHRRNFFVSKVKYARNEDGDYVQQIFGYGFTSTNQDKTSTTEQVYMTTSDFVFNTSHSIAQAHGMIPVNNQVQPGDVIRFNLDSKGKMKNARLEFRYTPDNLQMINSEFTANGLSGSETNYQEGKNTGYQGNIDSWGFGKIAFHELGNAIVALTYDDGRTMQLIRRNAISNIPFIVYDTEEKTVEVTGTPDLRTCLYDGAENADKAYILTVYSKAMMIVVYK